MALFKTITLIFLVMALSAGVVNGQAITNAPKNFTGKVGETANFSCSVDFGGIQTTMSWEFADVPVYNYQFGTEDYPFGKKKYSVARDVTTFILTVSHLDHKDGGEYKCLVVDVWHTAVLLVLDTPDLFVSTTNPVAGNTADFMCTARFGGPRKETISPDQYPRLQMFLDGEPLHESTEEQIPAGSAYWYNLTQIKNMTLESSMNRKKAACVIETTSPSVQVTTTREVKVLYSPQGISFTPNRSEYDVGSVINCTADGNPEPHFLWSNTKNTRPATPGPSLLITEDLIGYNTWKCTASNTISGHSHQESIVAVFNVVLQEESNVSPDTRNDNEVSDPWIIAVGITIPVLLVIACLTALYCRKRLRITDIHSVSIEEEMEFLRTNPGENSEMTKSEKDGVSCKTKIARIDPQYDSDYRIALDNIVVIISSKAFDKPMLVSVKERDIYQKRQQVIKTSGLDEILKPVIQLSLEPLGLKLAKPAEVKVKNKKVTKRDKLLVFNRPQQDALWTDITSKCALKVTDEGVVFRVSVLADIEILLSNIATTEVSSQAYEMLNPLHFSCNFYVFYKPTELMLKFIIEALGDNNQTHRCEEPRGYTLVGTASNQSMDDNSLLKFYYDSCNDVVGEYTLKMEAHWDHFDLPVTAKRTGDLPDCITVYQKESDDEKQICNIYVDKDKSYNIRYEELTKIVASLNQWKDLDDNTAEMIQELLSLLTDKCPHKGPSPLSQLIKKVNSLIQSEHLVRVTKALVEKFAKTLRERQEDPLQCLVELLEKDDQPLLTKHPERLFEIVKELLKVDESANIRSRCFRLLITKTMEQSRSQEQWMSEEITSDSITQLHWNANLVQVLLGLIKNGADPVWSPTGTSEGSNLHMLVVAVRHVIPLESDIFENFMDLLEMMMTGASLDCNNVDDEGMTILHTVVDGNKIPLLPGMVEQLNQIIARVKTKNPTLINATNLNHDTPLHTFMTSVLAVAVKGETKDNRDAFITTAKEWMEKKDTFQQLLKSLMSETNINHQSKDNKTPLHYFTEYATDRQVQPETFLEIVKCLKSPLNIDIQDNNGDTALSMITSTADKWADHPQIFFEIVACLRSNYNVDLQNERKYTPILYFTHASKVWAVHPKLFLEVVKNLRSDSNINLPNENKHTPIYVFTLATKEWTDHCDIFLEIVKCLRTDSNIETETDSKYTPITVFTLGAEEWTGHCHTFLEVVKCLKSDSNINLQTEKKWTPLHIFILAAKAWIDHNIFLQVVECLRSDENIGLQDQSRHTSLYEFTVETKEWADQPDIFFEVVKYLKSDLNIDYKTVANHTPLFAVTLAAKEWAGKPDVFLEVVKFLKSDLNIDFQTEARHTPLHEFTVAAKEWAGKPDIFVEVVNCLKSDRNVNLKSETKQTPLFKFTLAAKEWANKPDIFYKVVECLKTDLNIDIQTENGFLPLHQVVKASDEWAKYPDTFLKVVECLISPFNVKCQTTGGNTVYGLFTKFAKNWSEKPFTKVLEYFELYLKENS